MGIREEDGFDQAQARKASEVGNRQTPLATDSSPASTYTNTRRSEQDTIWRAREAAFDAGHLPHPLGEDAPEGGIAGHAIIALRPKAPPSTPELYCPHHIL